MASKAKIIKKIDEVVKPYCQNEWCLLKEMLCCSHTDPRLYSQLKCVEIFKFDEGKRLNKDIGWNEAHMEWVVNGYAKAFADFYSEELTAEYIYQKIIENTKK